MPFCPRCRYEYQAGIDYCPDCNERLVYELDDSGLDEEPELYSAYDDWQPLARLTSVQYAEMVVEGLKANGIPALMLSETGHFGVTGQMGTGTFRPVGGGFLILVPNEFAEDADREAEVMLGEEWVKHKLE